MSDLDNYFSQQDKIDQLQAEIKRLKAKILNEQCSKSKYKRALKEETGKKELTRGKKAMELISKLKGTNKPTKLIREIARKCFLSETHITYLWYKVVKV